MLFICRRQSEHNCSGNKRQTNVRFVDDALKTRGIDILMLRIGCCLPPYKNFWLCAWVHKYDFWEI